MTAARLFAVSLLVAIGACATPGGKPTAVPAPRYELCNDPAFECAPATKSSEDAIRIDTNFATERRASNVG